MEGFRFVDELGPEKVLELYDPVTRLKGVLVVDNVAAGPAIGGVRMATDVSMEECFRLARAMTLKNAMAGLPHGGGKSVIAADPGMPQSEKVDLVRSFAHAISDVIDYIPGPDMGTSEYFMAHIRDVTGRAVGLPPELGGIPLDEIGATGYGLCAALEVARDFADFQFEGARIVVQGFGSVGQHAARFLVERGARLVAVSDSRGARSCKAGFDLEALVNHKRGGGSVVDCDQGEVLSAEDLLAVPCEVWIPAARPDVIRVDNVDRMNARVVVEGANIPASVEAERMLAERGVLVIPDFVANAGGVICASVEYHGGSQSQAMTTIADRISANVREVLTRSAAESRLPRTVADAIARERVVRAMEFRTTT
jgi:glutamate dehydrogenase/leucine dehydrogenase